MIQVLALLALFGFLILLIRAATAPHAEEGKRAAERGDAEGVQRAHEDYSLYVWAGIGLVVFFAIVLVLLASQ